MELLIVRAGTRHGGPPSPWVCSGGSVGLNSSANLVAKFSPYLRGRAVGVVAAKSKKISEVDKQGLRHFD